MLYRVRQFKDALFPNIHPAEVRWAMAHLPAEAQSLFLSQSRPEQRHALDVAQSLAKQYATLPSADLQVLLTAALLHDCGKSIITVRLWHRVLIVLMQKMPFSLWSYLENGHSFMKAPLKMASSHAQWGARLARQAGLNSQICYLIREHHSPQTPLGMLLEKADNAH